MRRRCSRRDDAALAEAIARSCAHKAAIVERDPFERGERALLNFGHTFAHAIESEQGYGGCNHGEAVAIGMVLAARLSTRWSLAPAADADRLRALLARFGLAGARCRRAWTPTRCSRACGWTRRPQAGGLRFVLWDRAGAARLVADVPEADVLQVLRGA